jgi:hypothetical protein
LQVLFTHRFVQHRARAIVALLALALVALTLAACGDDGGGGGGGGGSADAETLLRQTFTGSHDIRSGRADVQLRVVVDDPSFRGPVDVGISGPFQSAGSDEIPQFDLSLDVDAQGQTFEAGLISTSDRIFVELSGTAYEVPGDLIQELKDSWRRSQEEGSDQQMSLESLGLDPLSWLVDPTVEGSETVGGVETEHISAGIDVDALLDDVETVLQKIDEQGLAGITGQDVPDSISADARRQIEEAVRTAEFDVWTGSEDHTLRRLRVVLEIVPPEGDGPRSLDIELTVELTDLNEPQTIQAPASSRPLDELLGQFQGLLGGALGGAGGAGGGASSEQLDEYTRCIEQAGSDVARAQECADLLTQ